MADSAPLGFPTLPDVTDPGFLAALQRNFDDLARAIGPTAGFTTWAEIGVGSAPAFTGTWANFGGGLSAVAYHFDRLGNVVLKGQAAGGVAGTSIFTLPAGARPAERRDFPAAYAGGDGGATVAVLADGTIVPAAAMGNARISLDGIQFRAEQ